MKKTPESIGHGIRYLSSRDLDDFIRIRADSLKIDPLSFGGSSDQETDTKKARYNLDLDNSENFVLGYYYSQEICGMIGFVRNTGMKTRHSGRIWGFFVYPDYRGRGMGWQLLTECIDRIRQIPAVEVVKLGVTNKAPAALRLYEKLGFQPYGRDTMAYRTDENNYVEEILMSKKLK